LFRNADQATPSFGEPERIIMGIDGIENLKPGEDDNNVDEEELDRLTRPDHEELQELPQAGDEMVLVEEPGDNDGANDETFNTRLGEDSELYDGDVNVDTDPDDAAHLEDTAEPAEYSNVFDSSGKEDQVAREVLRGEWGTGQDRRNRLARAGFDPNKVEEKVKELANERKNA
jgi:CW_7 repeat